MKGRIGCPMGIVTRVPHLRELAQHGPVELSEKAKHRQEVLDWYYKKSRYYSVPGLSEVTVTCRHFGMHRSQFYRWKNRYDPKRPASLEPRSTAPKKKREPEYSRELAAHVRAIRKENQSYSGKKIRPMLLRTMPEAEVPSVSTLGRLISRENLFFRPDTKVHRKRSKAAVKGHERRRKPGDLNADAPNKVIEYDMKHVYLLGRKLYAFCAIDPFKKDAVLRIGTTPSSLNSKAALEEVTARYDKAISVLNDNGSENKGKAEEYLTSVTNDWLEKYHFYRPHESLGGLTPAAFSARLGISIPHMGSVL